MIFNKYLVREKALGKTAAGFTYESARAGRHEKCGLPLEREHRNLLSILPVRFGLLPSRFQAHPAMCSH